MTDDRSVDVLISYKSEERPVAERLAAALGRQWNVWWDHHLLAGDAYRRIIGEKLAVARCVVVLWSRRSTESEFVLDEAGRALRRGVLIPVRIESVDVPLGFGQLDYTDLFDWDGDETHPGFIELCNAITRRIGAPVAASAQAIAPAATPRPPLSRLLMIGAAALLAVAVGAAVLMNRGEAPPAGGPDTTPPPASTAGASTDASSAPLAVQVVVQGSVMATGTVIPSGLVVTPCHVVSDATELTLRGAGRWNGRATVVERHCDVDLALLEPEQGAILPNSSVIRFAGSLEVGEAIERFRGTGDRTPGKVLAPLESLSYLGDQTSTMRLLVTTNVSSGGDSGAPILDSAGRIVGLLVAGDGVTKSLAIPSETIRSTFIHRFAP
jgi:hypothetical protein